MSSHFITHLLAQRSLAISMQFDQIIARASLLVYPERSVVIQKYKKNVTYKRQERLKTKKQKKKSLHPVVCEVVGVWLVFIY